jgi:hypothetical protein
MSRVLAPYEFISSHLSVLAGTDFFSVEVLTLRGLVTYYVVGCQNTAGRYYRELRQRAFASCAQPVTA